MDADSLIEEAERKLKSHGGFLSSLFGGSSHSNTKKEEAAELFIQAANKLKFNKRWSDAAQNYQRAADLYLKTDSKYDASQNFVESSNCFRKIDPKLACQMLDSAIKILTDMGRFSMAARHCQTMAEIYELELTDNQSAMKYYEKAADIYQGEEATSSANKCRLRLAELSALIGDYKRAIDIFEDVALRSTQNNLLRYSVKDYLFKASICQLCIDALNAQVALNRYTQMYGPFADTSEYKLVMRLGQAIQQSDFEEFTAAVKDFDKIVRLGEWSSQMILSIQKSIKSEDNPHMADDPDELL